MGHLRVVVVELVHLLNELENALSGILRGQRGQLDTAEHEALHFRRVVLMYFGGDNLFDGLLHFLVAHFEVVLRQSLFNSCFFCHNIKL